MEIEELKQKWDLLSQEIEKQKIINKNLLDYIVNQKFKFLVSYNWLGIIIAVVIIPIVIIIGNFKDIPPLFMYVGISALILFLLWGIYNERLLLKTKLYKNDLITSEKSIIKYKQNTLRYYLAQYLFLIIYLLWFFITHHDLLIAAKVLELSVVLILGAIALSLWEFKWYYGKVKELQKSISDLKNFESD